MANKTLSTFNPKASNAAIFNSVAKRMTDDFHRRIPAATKADMTATINALNDNTQLENEWIRGLINKVGLTISIDRNWNNKLAKFKRGKLEVGETIEEINTGLVEAYVYDWDGDYGEQANWGRERPDVQVDYHHVNRENFYKITIDRKALKRAFLTEGGLSRFIQQVMAAATTSDEWDEYLAMRQLFRHYHDNGGFFRVHVPEIASGEAGRPAVLETLELMRAYSGKLEFPSTLYSVSGMPVWAKPEDLELFITPEYQAKMDVQGLASLFNVSYAELSTRITIIDRFPAGMEDVQAVLTTKDFFVVADVLYETTVMPNPAGLYENHFLHHHQILSVSRFVPAIAFTTGEGTVVTEEDTPVTGIEDLAVINLAGESITTVERGMSYQMTGNAITEGFNDALVFELIGADQRSYASYTTQIPVLHISQFESASEITVRVTSTDDPTFTQELELSVVGDRLVLWPNPEVIEDADNDGLPEVVPNEPARIGNEITIPTVTGVQYRVGGNPVNNGSKHTATASPGITVTAVARPDYELKTGVPASWTFVAE